MPGDGDGRVADNGRRWRGLFVLAGLLPLAAFAAVAVLATLGAHRAADEERLTQAARTVSAAVEARFGRMTAALLALSSSPMLDGDPDLPAFLARSRPVADAFGGSIVVFGPLPEARVLGVSHPGDTMSPRDVPAPETQAILATSLATVFGERRPAVTGLLEGVAEGRPILMALVPVERDGQVHAALGISVCATSLLPLLTLELLPGGTFAAVADAQLRVLAHSLDPGGLRTGSPAPAWVADAVARGERDIVVGPGWAGRNNVYAVEHPPSATGWTVVVAEAVADQWASAWRAVKWLFAGLAALGLGGTLAALMSRRQELAAARRETELLRAGRSEVQRLHAALSAILFLREVSPDGASRLLYRGGDIETVSDWPPEAFAGHNALLPFAVPGTEPLADTLRRVLRDGQADWEWQIRQPDGAIRTVWQRARRLSGSAETGGQVVGYMLDVTGQREAEARAAAAGRLASPGEMAAGLAHELKQPLQNISLAAELAQLALAGDEDAEAARRLALIVAQVQRAADLIERLRRFARGPEQGVPPADVALADVVEGTLALSGRVLAEAGIDVEVALGEPPPIVRGDALLLEQVLSNLLLNARDALQALPPGAPRRIRIAAGPAAWGRVSLTVSDTGGGFPPEVLARLFQPFVTTKGPDRGTGLGLSICHGLLGATSGAISARNSADGAEVTLLLPAAAPAQRRTAALAGAPG